MKSNSMTHVYGCTGHELKILNIVGGQGLYLFTEAEFNGFIEAFKQVLALKK